jgi:diguanylate cyclase (GGDEF)-like protein
MQFDSTTTLIAVSAILAVLGVQSLFFWNRERREAPWLGWFGSALLCAAGAVELCVFAADRHDFLSVAVGNGLCLVGGLALWHSARVFARRRAEHLIAVLAIAIWLGLCSIPVIPASAGLRLILVSAAVALFVALSAAELWRSREEGLPSIIPAVVIYGTFATLLLLRLPFADLAPFPVGAMPAGAAWLAASGFVLCFLASFAAMLMLSMTRERREAEQHHDALLDPLTALLNRRAFLDAVKHRDRRRSEIGGRVAVLMLDLDHFKLINDRFGHEAGDQVLLHFAEVARASTRPGDLLHRMGGEEFCFVLPGVTSTEAHMVAERIRTRFADSPTEFDGLTIPATVSIGVAATTRENFDLEVLLAAADEAVYAAKQRGRNQTAIADTATIRLEPTRRRAVA